MNLLRKIGAGPLGYSKTFIKAALKESEDKPIQLFILAGRATGIKTGESQYGEWTGFIGSFAAIPVAAGGKFAVGEEVRGNRAFPPQPFQDLLESAIRSNENGVEFSIEVWVGPSEKGDYEYEVKPIVKIKEADEISGLLEQAKAKLALPAKKEKK